MKISVITVAYNSAGTIASTLESVAEQTHPDVEYILVDGASTDGTLSIVEQHPSLVSKMISEPDKGIYDAMNKGVRMASGEVVGILNSDDFFLHREVLSEVAAIFEANPSLDVVMGEVDFVADSDLDRPVRTYRTGFFRPWMLRLGLMPPHPAVFVRKSAYERLGTYKLGYKIAADFDFLIRLLLVDQAPYQVVNKRWVRMRTGGASTAGWRSNMISTREMCRALRENSVFSTRFLVMMRLPIKLLRQVWA